MFENAISNRKIYIYEKGTHNKRTREKRTRKRSGERTQWQRLENNTENVNAFWHTLHFYR